MSVMELCTNHFGFLLHMPYLALCLFIIILPTLILAWRVVRIHGNQGVYDVLPFWAEVSKRQLFCKQKFIVQTRSVYHMVVKVI